MKTKEPKFTNKQNRQPDTHRHYHKQGLTCDCKVCEVEFTQYHPKHVYCSDKCRCEDKQIPFGPQQCSRCGCVDEMPIDRKGYRCSTCKMLSLNPERTDVTRRIP